MNSAEMPCETRSNRSRIRGEKAPASLPMGTRVIDSVPPPIASSIWPAWIAWASRISASLLTVASLREIPHDGVLLDLGRAFPDAINDGVHEPAADVVLLHEPVAAVDLDGVEACLDRDLAAVVLCLAPLTAGE